MIFRKGQLGQIIISPFVIGLIIILMTVFVALSATVFKISSGVSSGEVESPSFLGLGETSWKALLFKEFNFGSRTRDMFVVEAVILSVNGDLEYTKFEDGLMDLFKGLESERDDEIIEYCLGFAYNTRKDLLWNDLGVSYNEGYNKLLRWNKESSRKGEVEVIDKPSWPSTRISYFISGESNLVRTRVFHEGREIFISYFYDDCSEVFE